MRIAVAEIQNLNTRKKSLGYVIYTMNLRDIKVDYVFNEKGKRIHKENLMGEVVGIRVGEYFIEDKAIQVKIEEGLMRGFTKTGDAEDIIEPIILRSDNIRVIGYAHMVEEDIRVVFGINGAEIGTLGDEWTLETLDEFKDASLTLLDKIDIIRSYADE